MIGPDTLMVDLADRGENPAEAPYACYIEIDKEERQAIIVWSEYLHFHADYNGPREYPAHAGYPAWKTEDNWSQYVEDGWLTSAAEDYLVDRLADLIEKQAGVGRLQVYTLEYGGDEPNITFEVVTDYQDGETYDHWMDRIGWPVVATLINVTDPGTFNSAYLFDMREVAR